MRRGSRLAQGVVTIPVDTFVPQTYFCDLTLKTIRVGFIMSAGEEAKKMKPSHKLTSFSISSILGRSRGDEQTIERPRKTSPHETASIQVSAREEPVTASGDDQDTSTKVAAMTAWYPWILQQAQHYSFVEGTWCILCIIPRHI